MGVSFQCMTKSTSNKKKEWNNWEWPSRDEWLIHWKLQSIIERNLTQVNRKVSHVYGFGDNIIKLFILPKAI